MVIAPLIRSMSLFMMEQHLNLTAQAMLLTMKGAPGTPSHGTPQTYILRAMLSIEMAPRSSLELGTTQQKPSQSRLTASPWVRTTTQSWSQMLAQTLLLTPSGSPCLMAPHRLLTVRQMLSTTKDRLETVSHGTPQTPIHLATSSTRMKLPTSQERGTPAQKPSQ